MKILKNISQIATLSEAHNKDGRNLLPDDLGIISDASMVYDEDKIVWVGKSTDLPKEYGDLNAKDMKGYCITPELVESHTHIVFGGNRADEYSMRLNGADYQEIAKAGGGILSTMKATNEESDEVLFSKACDRIEKMYQLGVGTIEIKTGYSLTYEGEKRCLKIINRLKKTFAPKVQIFTTYLAAHAVPKEYSSSNEFLKKVVIPLLKDNDVKELIDAVDIFHEQGYFDEVDTRELFDIAKSLDMQLKIHADEFNDNGGATIACEYQALSCDHLLCTGDKGIENLSKSSTVATLLPGTGWFLGKPQANGKKLLESGAKVAIATDYNPGSCHFNNLLLLASQCAPMYPMNMAQMWAAITLNSAHALGLKDQGAIKEGLKPRFNVFKTNSISEITYNWGQNLVVRDLL